MNNGTLLDLLVYQHNLVPMCAKLGAFFRNLVVLELVYSSTSISWRRRGLKRAPRSDLE